MNKQYIFFWNKGRAWKLSLEDKKITSLNIYISELETATYIKAIRATSDDRLVCIRVVQSDKEDCMILWNLKKDVEKYSFDIQKDAILFQDFNGKTYIAEKDYIINCEQGCKLKCYNFSIKDFNMENCSFKCNYGHRMEV